MAGCCTDSGGLLTPKGIPNMPKYDWVDERGINRRGGPLIAW